jgi:TolB-like protein/cytochrome c-type biogenesis protein CcmH/NrfG
MNPRSFFAELKRRNVYKVAVAYAVVGWLVMQVAATVVPALHLPNAITSAVVLLTILGFPIALVLAWAFELTPEGIKRTEEAGPGTPTRRTGPKVTAFILIAAVAAAALLAFQFLRTKSASPTAEKSQPSATAGAIPLKSIAVLPFASLSEDKANEYFASGIQDEILTRLAKIADLKVISRTSTQQYQSKPGNLPEIAKQLGVAHILEGSVQKVGDAVRINVQLIKAETDAHLWADTYDRKLTDIFAVETEVAQKIASSLAAHLTGGEQRQIAAVPTRNPQAYDAYLRGRALIIRESEEQVEKARDFFQQAVELDPEYAQAWAQLSIAESELYFAGAETPARLERARHAAETAVRLQPELSDAHSSLGLFYYFCRQDFDRALVELEEARKRSPNDGSVIFYTGLVKRRQGKLEEAIELIKKATVFDPRNPEMLANLGRSYRGKRDFKAAREMFDHAFTVSPDEVQFIAEKAESYTAEGNLDAAENLLRRYDPTQSNIAIETYIEILVYRRRFEEAVQALSKTLEQRRNLAPLAAADTKSWLGGLHHVAGHQAEARALFEEARKELMALRDKGETSWRLTRALIWAKTGLNDREAVEREVPDLLSRTQHDLWRAPSAKATVAGVYATFGDPDRAIPFLEQALAASYHTSITPALLRLDPVWDPIRNDPRFQKLAAEKPKP